MRCHFDPGFVAVHVFPGSRSFATGEGQLCEDTGRGLLAHGYPHPRRVRHCHRKPPLLQRAVPGLAHNVCLARVHCRRVQRLDLHRAALVRSEF